MAACGPAAEGGEGTVPNGRLVELQTMANGPPLQEWC
eukprot:CAMPEP_0172698780 /NCGR_PEP_ID=MMETSP1074-20121228/29707_1 /TAXON_ID=2916 /ORGANISM="Ceratium fusus, Strain PA161109" /LENGTH=36 /DNA_ID= /DNA_START= /DNA_END= /DNA_ORIENTATION=